ncbi:hypothetical protein [Vibrio sp. 1180_3]|uniref:hypothetical protein n=1 Tax=Vibrio sp. 1180_3 TaxID=2528832 RepID=UPI00240640B9|nr:hypothetical protein [Vibrio sp. 1180_3]MDF9399057.1 hypothetical protein [Vibrio sp. 1180_3]
MNLKQQVAIVAAESGMIEFMTKLAMATDAFESVIIQQSIDSDVIGYQAQTIIESVISYRRMSLVRDKKALVIAVTNTGEHWVLPSQIKNSSRGLIVEYQRWTEAQPIRYDKIVPATGY